MPEQIYWRRRAVAVGGAVVLLIVVVLLLATQCGGSNAPAENAANTTSEQDAMPAKSTSATSTTAEPETTAATPTQSEQDEAAAVAQGQCPDSAIGITVASDQPNYAVGEGPTFFTTITNIGNVACARDLSDGLTPNVVSTLDGQTRLWASTDCYPGGEPRIVTLQPGQQDQTKLKWTGTTSNNGCGPDERVQVAPGAYTVIAFSGGRASVPETFNIG